MNDMSERTYHYRVIARAIALIDAGGPDMALAELAARLGMSPAHFQRLFSQWVGVSPKRYQQYLTLAHARDMLRARHSTLETALGTGLSGTGRLHDLFLRWEAMPPGSWARGGAGVAIAWGVFDSPFGEMLAAGTEHGLCGLGFTAEQGRDAVLEDFRGRWPEAAFREDTEALTPWVEAALAQRGEARLALIGGPFQIKVWEALLAIPEGRVTTYSDIARAIGHPRAARAVGSAVGANPIGWLIPCHRVLRREGGLGGYHWGLPVKRAMLAWEGARMDAREAAEIASPGV